MPPSSANTTLSLLGTKINHNLALGAYNLRKNIMPMCHRPPAIKIRNPPTPKLHNPNAIIDILQRRQFSVMSNCADGLGHRGLGPEQPQRQVDVVDAAVDEHAAVLGGVAH